MSAQTTDGILGVRVDTGATILVPADVRLLTPFVLLEQERWFEDEVRLVARALGPGMRAVDVGANYGCYATTMAMAVGATGQVLCLEPAPDTARLLRATLARNGLAWAEVSETAVSDAPGEVRFRLDVAAENNHIATGADDGDPAARYVTVPRRPLDELVPRADWSAVDLVKIDAEGHTLEAIEGGAGLFRHGAPMVLFEILLESGALEESLGERFRAWGYDLFRWVPGPGVLEPVPPGHALDAYQMNLVALKPGRAAALAARGLLVGTSDRVVDAPSGAWEAHASGLAVSRHMAGRWRHRGRWLERAGDRAFRSALDLYAHALDPRTYALARVAALHAALEQLAAGEPAGDPVPRLCGIARVAAALGLRSRSTAALRELVQLAQAGSAGLGALPFPPPAPRFDTVAVEGPEVEWMEAAIYEAALDQAAWSAFFVGADWLPLVERQLELPYATALVRRRLQLIRMRYGLQDGPQPDPVLTETTGATLNPAFWSGQAPLRS